MCEGALVDCLRKPVSTSTAVLGGQHFCVLERKGDWYFAVRVRPAAINLVDDDDQTTEQQSADGEHYQYEQRQQYDSFYGIASSCADSVSNG